MIFFTRIYSSLSSMFLTCIEVLTNNIQGRCILLYYSYSSQCLYLMNKSKSQTQIPSRPTHNKRQKSDFVYSVEDDAFIFQTKDLFMQVQFRSAIKEIFEYLEQYEKYGFLSEVSSIGIKAYQEKQLYDRVSAMVKKQYQKYLETTMQYIETMIMNVHYMRYQKWHYYRQLIKGFKTHILNKDIDCYGFDISQFDTYYQQVLQYLMKKDQKCDPVQAKMMKSQIKANCKQIHKKIQQINENMYVKNPCKTENIRKMQVDSNELFDSYLKAIIYNTVNLQESFDLRLHTAYDGINKFAEFLKQESLYGQAIALNFIKEYEKSYKCVNEIRQNLVFCGIGNEFQKKQFDISEYHGDWQQVSKHLPIIRNKIERVSFSDRIIVKDEGVQDYYTAPSHQESHFRDYSYQEEELNHGRIPANNPYFNFWDHTYDRQRLRKLHLFFEEAKDTQKLTQSNRKDYEVKVKRKLNKQRKLIESSLFPQLIEETKAEQEKLWALQDKSLDRQKKEAYFSKIQTSVLINHEQNKLEQQQKKIEAYREYQQKMEKERKGQEDIVMVNLRKAGGDKLFEQFCRKFAIKDVKRECSKTKIYRYGLKVEKFVYNNTQLANLEEFMCNFLRQKLFRDHQIYRQRQSMPLIMNTKPASQFCNWRTIKRLGQMTQTMKKYFIWASEIIKYEQITSINREVTGKFTIYAYTDPKHSQSLLFELKRRLNIKITGQVIQQYHKFPQNSLESIMSKLQLVYRLIFTQNCQSQPHLSHLRGQLIFNQIAKQLINDSAMMAQT